MGSGDVLPTIPGPARCLPASLSEVKNGVKMAEMIASSMPTRIGHGDADGSPLRRVGPGAASPLGHEAWMPFTMRLTSTTRIWEGTARTGQAGGEIDHTAIFSQAPAVAGQVPRPR